MQRGTVRRGFSRPLLLDHMNASMDAISCARPTARTDFAALWMGSGSTTASCIVPHTKYSLAGRSEAKFGDAAGISAGSLTSFRTELNAHEAAALTILP